MLLSVAMEVTVATTMATTLMEETTTAAIAVVMAALPLVTMAMAVTEATLLVVSLFIACFFVYALPVRELALAGSRHGLLWHWHLFTYLSAAPLLMPCCWIAYCVIELRNSIAT